MTKSVINLRAHEIAALEILQPASDALLQKRVLQRRTDAKFVASRRVVCELLERLAGDFVVLLSEGARWATYDTLYFDSPQFDFFHSHRRGLRPRHKVRIRHYAERDVCFLETKTKDRYAVTSKMRFRRNPRDFELSKQDLDQVRGVIGPTGALAPTLRVRFPRVSLLGLEHAERLTIDLGLRVGEGGFQASFEEACIIELKQARFDICSPGAMALRNFGLRPQSMSKYCVGLSVLGQVRRTNMFRPAIRELERIHA